MSASPHFDGDWETYAIKLEADLAAARASLDRYEEALRWLYHNGVQTSHTRPEAIGKAFDDAFAPVRITPETKP